MADAGVAPAAAAGSDAAAAPIDGNAALEQRVMELSVDALRQAITGVVQGQDLARVSVGEVRKQAAEKLGLPPLALEIRKTEIKQLTQDAVRALEGNDGQPEPAPPSALDALLAEEEVPTALQQVYLITMARVLTATLPDGSNFRDLQSVERKDIAQAVLDAFNNPMSTGAGSAGGRPRAPAADGKTSTVSLLAVFREAHEDGAPHFHIVVKLARTYRWKNIKRTLLERHKLPSHFSSSHRLLWSAMRYCYIETPKKPNVDTAPWLWTPAWTGFASEQTKVDLFDLSQEPYRADSWRKRRIDAEKEASKKQCKQAFTKLDLTSVIIAKHLWSKDALCAYTQDYGSHLMKTYVHNRQRKLDADIEDAAEWASAKDNAEFEAISDFELVCRCAQKDCPHGEAVCTYRAAVQQIFERNAQTLNWRALALAMRDILCHGPKKTTRVPFLVGPSNSGKSTLLYPLDDLFQPRRVHHKPALGSNFGLRNLCTGKKRFIFWDDFRPVEYAHEKTVPVSLFLSLFVGQHVEIQVSQSFNDGNKDTQWKRGAAFTAKLDGLWEPTKLVGPEDIRHMRNRVREFQLFETIADGSLQDVVSCAPCMCKWIVQGAAAADAQPALGPMLPVRQGASRQEESPDPARVAAIGGLHALLAAAQLPGLVASALLEDLEELGAVNVAELAGADWEAMHSWGLLRTLQRRRVLAHVGAQPQSSA